MTVSSTQGEPGRSELPGRPIPETFVDYCGERFPVSPDDPFHIRREADLDVDDSPDLRRNFLMLHHEERLWWLSNVCSHLSAGVVALTESQKLLIVVSAEEVLRRSGTGASSIPSSAQAARRLGWSITKFNRKLDNVCDKFDLIGVSGMRGGSGRLASSRRVKLVEYAVASRLVTAVICRWSTPRPGRTACPASELIAGQAVLRRLLPEWAADGHSNPRSVL